MSVRRFAMRRVHVDGCGTFSFAGYDEMATPITQHAGSKYLRWIRSAVAYGVHNHIQPSVQVDVYAVLKAFNVTCPACQHAIKKLLCAGLRDKGSRLADLQDTLAAINRAIELEMDDLNSQDEKDEVTKQLDEATT